MVIAVKAKKEAVDTRKLVITSNEPGGVFFVELWFYDDTDSVWFDSTVTVESWNLSLYGGEPIGDNISVTVDYLTLYPKSTV